MIVATRAIVVLQEACRKSLTTFVLPMISNIEACSWLFCYLRGPVHADPQQRGSFTTCVTIVHEGKRPTALCIESTCSGHQNSLKPASRPKLPAAPEAGPRCLPRRWVAVRQTLPFACSMHSVHSRTPTRPDRKVQLPISSSDSDALDSGHTCGRYGDTSSRYVGSAPNGCAARVRSAEQKAICIRIRQKEVTDATRGEGDSRLRSMWARCKARVSGSQGLGPAGKGFDRGEDKVYQACQGGWCAASAAPLPWERRLDAG